MSVSTYTPRIGIDLGGSKIEICVLDERGEFALRHRITTPQDGYEATLRAIAVLVADAEKHLSLRANIGIGTPGSISPFDGLMRNSNSVCLNGKPFKADIETLLAREVRIANDADCFALSEARDGAGAGAHSVFGVILGTGVGGGLVLSGQLLRGANAIAGEWGHNPLAGETEAFACYCGRRGCVETYLSGPALAAEHQRLNGGDAQVPDIVARAVEGDAACLATLVRYEQRLAKALATVINIVDPEVIVLGGGLSNVRRLYEQVPRHWGTHVFSDAVRTRLLPNRHGDSGGVRGAAWLWS